MSPIHPPAPRFPLQMSGMGTRKVTRVSPPGEKQLQVASIVAGKWGQHQDHSRPSRRGPRSQSGDSAHLHLPTAGQAAPARTYSSANMCADSAGPGQCGRTGPKCHLSRIKNSDESPWRRQPGPRQRGTSLAQALGSSLWEEEAPLQRREGRKFQTRVTAPVPHLAWGRVREGRREAPGPRGHLLLELCCPPPASPSTACAPGSGPPGVSPTWPCLWTGPGLGPSPVCKSPLGPTAHWQQGQHEEPAFPVTEAGSQCLGH